MKFNILWLVLFLGLYGLAVGKGADRSSYEVVKVAEFAEKADMCKLIGQIVDGDSGQVIPARVIVTTSRGSYADGSHGGAVCRDGRFYVDGNFWVIVPGGKTKVSVYHGFEYEPLRDVVVEALGGKTVTVKFSLHRWVDMRKLGWYGGDNHFHTVHGEREIETSLEYGALVARAEGLDYITDMGDFSERSRERCRQLSGADFLMVAGREVGIPFQGHFLPLGLAEPIEDVRNLSGLNLMDDLHKQGGVLVYTHPTGFPTVHWMMNSEVLADVVIGRYGDGFDVLCYSNASNDVAVLEWFLFLNLGCKMAGMASTNACLDRRGDGPPGGFRTYTYTGGEFSYAAILKGLREGRNFVTSGPLVFLRVDDAQIGDTLEVVAGHLYKAWIKVQSPVEINKVELIRNGKVVKAFVPSKANPFYFEGTYDFEEDSSCWYVVRVLGERMPDGYQESFALTNPIYFDRSKYEDKAAKSMVAITIGDFQIPSLTITRRYNCYVFSACDRDIQRVELLKDGRVLRVFPGQPKARNLAVVMPLWESGWYQACMFSIDGEVHLSRQIHFDKNKDCSHLISYWYVGEERNNLRLEVYGEDLKNSEPVPAGYVGWYSRNSYWRAEVVLDGEKHEVSRGKRWGFRD